MTARLVLFFTEGVSLQTWDQVGMLERELALYKGLYSRGIEAEFVTYGNKKDLVYRESFPFLDIHSNARGLPIGWYRQSLQWFPPKGEIFKSNQVAGSMIAMKAARRAGSKFIARCGYLLSEFEEKRHGNQSDKAEKARQLEKAVFRGADRIVVTTPVAADSIQKKYQIEKKNIYVIPNYVETDRFKPEPNNGNKSFRIITVGRLELQKNVGTLIQAVSLLDVELVIVGDGSQRQELEYARRNTTARIRFLGNISNKLLPKMLSDSDLFVLPSLYEGHPKALLEAMSCGLPVVGTRVSGIQELIRDGENGLLSETDPESLREKIMLLLGNPDLRMRLGKAARNYVKKNFSLNHIIDLEVSLINELMSEKHAKS